MKITTKTYKAVNATALATRRTVKEALTATKIDIRLGLTEEDGQQLIAWMLAAGTGNRVLGSWARGTDPLDA